MDSGLLRCIGMTLVAGMWLAGCECSNRNVIVLDSEASSGSSGERSTDSEGSNTGTAGEWFDASRWIGRYHFENTFITFGERGDSGATNSLVNFEILADSTATIFYDDCAFDVRRARHEEL